jgi:PKD repeat protein
MKLFKLYIFTFAVSLFMSSLSAQNSRSDHWCATDQNYEEIKANNPSSIPTREAVEAYIKSYVHSDEIVNKVETIIIPVVVHNITHDGGIGYVSKNEIEGQINRLNIDFKRENTDAVETRSVFAPFVASLDIEFRLAHIDPNGECTEGIVRLENSLSLYPVPREAIKSVSYWPNNGTRKYFNIWIIDEIETVSTGGYVAGYAAFPGDNNNGKYGVVMTDQSIGFNERTLTHEVGHCLSLYHIFNYQSNDCSNPNDECSDTPRQDQSYTSACNYAQNTCGNVEADYGSDVVDQIENYMSYANCQNMFTLDQKARMEAILANTNVNQGLAHLATASNLAATGVANPYSPSICIPVADFKYAISGQALNQKEVYICEGDSIAFADNSFNATPTTFDWIFTGGRPSSSALESPSIIYNTPGVYSVTHQPATTAGSGSEAKTNIITVSSMTADYAGVISDGFEDLTAFNNDWRIENVNDGSQNFTRITSAAASGSASVRILNKFISVTDELHELISPSYDLSSLTDPVLSFKLSFARILSSNTDRLLVWYSLDCGSSWSLALPPMQGSSLSSIGSTFNTGLWTPSTAADWVTKSGSLASITNETNVRFKFAFKTGGGNNLYLDDINIDGTVSIGEALENVQAFNVFPNPTNASAKVSFKLVKEVENLSITVRNAVGQVVTNVVNGKSFNAGEYTLNIDQEKKLASGLYFIVFNADDKIQVQKLIVK